MLNITLCNFLLNAHKNITFARFPFQLSSKVSGHTVKSKCFAILVIRLWWLENNNYLISMYSVWHKLFMNLDPNLLFKLNSRNFWKWARYSISFCNSCSKKIIAFQSLILYTVPWNHILENSPYPGTNNHGWYTHVLHALRLFVEYLFTILDCLSWCAILHGGYNMVSVEGIHLVELRLQPTSFNNSSYPTHSMSAVKKV